MKKLLAILFLTVLISCSDSDNDAPAIPAELIGKWKYVESLQDYVEVDSNGNEIHYYIDNGFIIEFKDDGTFTSNEIDELSSGTYTVNNQFITLKYRSGINTLKYYRSFHYYNDERLFVSGPSNIPMTEATPVFDGYILSKIL